MRALVTGASGFIGSHLVDHLLSKGFTVRVLLRKTSSQEWLRNVPVEVIYGDLFTESVLLDAVRGVDYVYHSAGLTKAKTPEEYFRANATGTRNLLLASQKASPALRRFVHVSSQAAVGPSSSLTPIDESVTPHPLTTYGRSKWAAEQECLTMMASLPITIVRPPAVFGPRDRDILEFFSTVNKGLQPIVGFASKYISLIHVTDLARGCVMAGESPNSIGKAYFISSKRAYDWKEIGDLTSRIIGKKVLRVRIPEPAVYLIAAVAEAIAYFSPKPALVNLEKARDMVQQYWTCDSSRALTDFGYEQNIDLEEGIRNTVEWYRARGWI
jgi:dihydroflavonol-4-reductase